MKKENRQPTIKVGDLWYVTLGFMDVEKIIIHEITDKTVALYTPLPQGEQPQVKRYKTTDVEWVELIRSTES